MTPSNTPETDTSLPLDASERPRHHVSHRIQRERRKLQRNEMDSGKSLRTMTDSTWGMFLVERNERKIRNLARLQLEETMRGTVDKQTTN